MTEAVEGELLFFSDADEARYNMEQKAKELFVEQKKEIANIDNDMKGGFPMICGSAAQFACVESDSDADGKAGEGDETEGEEGEGDEEVEEEQEVEAPIWHQAGFGTKREGSRKKPDFVLKKQKQAKAEIALQLKRKREHAKKNGKPLTSAEAAIAVAKRINKSRKIRLASKLRNLSKYGL